MDGGELPEYAEAVLDVVDSVPPGRVTTYGRVAAVLREAGLGGSARTVGAVMAAHGGAVAWWRVCPVSGAPPAHPEEAVRRWADERTPLRPRSSRGRDHHRDLDHPHELDRDSRRDPAAVRVDMAAALSELRPPAWLGAR